MTHATISRDTRSEPVVEQRHRNKAAWLLDNLSEIAAALAQAEAAGAERVCKWTLKGNDWVSECQGIVFGIDTADGERPFGISRIDKRFCLFCGGRLKVEEER